MAYQELSEALEVPRQASNRRYKQALKARLARLRVILQRIKQRLGPEKFRALAKP